MTASNMLMSDIEIVREAIELFIIHYFETINMSGSVRGENKEGINYVAVDLTNIEWDNNLIKLHQTLLKYLDDWAKQNLSNFKDYIAISRINIEYLLPQKDGANQNVSKHIKLFFLPSYYYKAGRSSNGKIYSGIVLKLLIIWHNILLRNTIITLVPTIVFIVISVYKNETDKAFSEKITKAYDYTNIASGIIASFVLGFLINKVITIRQDKLKYTKRIRKLSNKLTYFRNICFNLVREHNFWTKEKPFYKSYEYANSIKHDISFEEYYYPNFDDNIKYSKYKSFYREDLWHSVISLVLQLHMLADDLFVDSGLSYTAFPSNYIYSYPEMQKFQLFCESNLIWYCATETKIFPKTFNNSYHIGQIVEDYNRIYPNTKVQNLTSDALEELSLDFQYKIIPKLYNLTRLVDSALPLTIRYFCICFSMLLAFGLIIPTLTYIFIDKTYAFLCVFVVIGIIVHILLTLAPILENENALDTKNDYL